MTSKEELKISKDENTLSSILTAIDDLKRDTSSQLIRVGRRLNALEKRVSIGDQESECERSRSRYSGSVDKEDRVSMEAYGTDGSYLKRKKLVKKKPTASPWRNNRRVRQDTSSVFAAIQSDNLQTEFQSVKESYNRQRLPKDLKFSGSVKGVKAQSRDIGRLHVSSGRYLETAIKVASNIQAQRDLVDYDVSSDIEDLLICLIAHMRFIQEEHCMLLVRGNYGPRTQQIFRAIHSNPSQYTATVVDELKTSATLAALPSEIPASNGRPNCEGHDYRQDFQHDYRSNYRNNGFRGRGRSFSQFGQQLMADNIQTPGFRSCQVPSDRQLEDN